MKNIIEYKSFESEVKDFDKGKREFVQAYTMYDVEDSDGDFGRKGMFSKTWKENNSRIKHILNHDITHPIGKPLELWDDNNHAFIKSRIGTHKDGDDFIEMVDSGLITEASYGFQVIKDNKMSDGKRELLEVKLWEVSSLTGWGANQHTPVVSLQKSLSKDGLDILSKRINLIEKFIRKSNASDETIETLVIELKQLQQLFIDLTKTTEPESNTTLPEGKKGELLNALTTLDNRLNTVENGIRKTSNGKV